MSKKVSKPACVTNTSAGRKGHPGECFSPLSENIENLCKLVTTSYAASGNPACGGAFADFQMFSDSRHRRLARQELPARQISANLSRKKPNCFVEIRQLADWYFFFQDKKYKIKNHYFSEIKFGVTVAKSGAKPRDHQKIHQIKIIEL
ncbi:MAG TPA: hypothetical protein PKW80_09725 [Bacteroidales bacterium]|nr:hypothetical protein [Bacteroidales bacterium]